MADRTFQALVNIIVTDEDVEQPKDMEFTLDELKTVLNDCVILDIDGEENSIGKNSRISNLELDWEVLQELDWKVLKEV